MEAMSEKMESLMDEWWKDEKIKNKKTKMEDNFYKNMLEHRWPSKQRPKTTFLNVQQQKAVLYLRAHFRKARYQTFVKGW